MAKFVVPNSARMRIDWNLGGTLCSNVFGGKATGSGTVTQATADALRDIVTGAWNSSGLAPHFPPTSGLLRVAIRNVNTADLPEFTSSISGVPGTAATESLPRGVAAVVTFKTAKAGKRNRGRAFMSGLSEDENSSSQTISPAAEAACVAFWSAIDANLGGTGYDFAVISPALPARLDHNGNTLPAELANSEPITSVTMRNTQWGSQRRRNHRT